MIIYLITTILKHPSKIFLHHLPNAILKHRILISFFKLLKKYILVLCLLLIKYYALCNVQKLIQGGNTQPV